MRFVSMPLAHTRPCPLTECERYESKARRTLLKCARSFSSSDEEDWWAFCSSPPSLARLFARRPLRSMREDRPREAAWLHSSGSALMARRPRRVVMSSELYDEADDVECVDCDDEDSSEMVEMRRAEGADEGG